MSLAVVRPGTIHVDDISIEYKRQPGSADGWPNYVHPDRFVSVVPFDRVTVTGGLWKQRMDVNRAASLPHVWGRCEYSQTDYGADSKRLENFQKTAGRIDGDFTGIFFNDLDVYKIIEGTANSLRNHPDPKLEAYYDIAIDSIAAEQ